MRVTWFRSASVGVESAKGSRVLCDPWINNGAFIGSWYHWPPLEGWEESALLSTPWDGVYISHLHADHFDRRFLSKLARLQPNCVAIVPKLPSPWLARAVANTGFEGSRLRVVESGSYVQVGDITLAIYSADHCDPTSCGVSVPCHSEQARSVAIDSLATFSADGTVVANANDALAVATVARVLPRLGRVDLLMGHFGGAGPYPQCFTDLPDEAKLLAAKRVAHAFIDRLGAAADAVKASFVFPFAGQYLLSGRLVTKNEFRAVLPMKDVVQRLRGATESEPITLAPFEYFEVGQGSISAPWIDPPELRLQAYQREIARVEFPYERGPGEWLGFTDTMLKATSRVQRALTRASRGSSLSGTASFILSDQLGQSITLDFTGPELTASPGDTPRHENVTKITTDARLWKRIVSRAAGYAGFTQYHFNQAEIGSHLEWRRSGRYPPETRFLNFLQE